MEVTQRRIELLAPAKDLECGIAAIHCGADAVYIGASSFGAREAAGNDLGDITKLLEHAHRYWAKVYVTVNTLLRDDELPQAVSLIHRLYDAGVDGVIIQDVGLLECDLPPVPIIASTQMHNSTPERVAFLEKVGINRAILARELDIEQIREIRAAASIELETFIHGALCVCYSGQCYLSYALGGRSGNRGQCAQPCRKLYKLLDSSGTVVSEGKHLLSLKDLNLTEHLCELLEAGVTAFKVEGRLKDKFYVSNIVTHYRAELDRVMGEMGLAKSSSGRSASGFAPIPDKTFNRGYSTYFLNGKGAAVGSPDTPKMVGEFVGRIVSVGTRGFTLDRESDLRGGDGISFFVGGELSGTLVNRAGGRQVFPEKMDGLRPGMDVFRNRDHAFLSSLEKSRPERRISVRLALSETGTGFAVTAEDEDGVRAQYSIDGEKVPAQKPEQAASNIETQLKKTGDTEFACSDVGSDLAQPYFLPISTLNALRRGVLEALSEERSRQRPVGTGQIFKNDVPYPEKKLDYHGNVLNASAAAFYRRHGVDEIEPAAESGLDLTGREVMVTRYCIKRQLGICPVEGGGTGAKEPLYLVDEEGHRLRLRFDCRACRMHVHLESR